MGVKAQIIDTMFNQLYAQRSLVVEFDTQIDTTYIVKELNRRVERTEKLIKDLEEDVEENRVRVEWINLSTDINWPRRASLTLITKAEIQKTFGFRIISISEDSE